ncbi:MAG: YceI family protein [Balneolaceae bacterium]|nr:YceI family protein [Balneolaceae bacterium]
MKVICTLIVSLILFNSGYTQNNYTLDKSQSTVSILGTSTVHDWESVVEDFSVVVAISSSEDQPINIQSFSFMAQVKSIESGKRIMNRKTMSALNEKDHPQITFTLVGPESITAESVTATGLLSIAGQENEVAVSATYSLNDKSFQLTGSKAILMSDFGIEPPTAMMGTMKTGDEVTIEFTLYLTKQ